MRTANRGPRFRFPANSNDLNIIENVWGEVALIIEQRESPRTIAQLHAACQLEWKRYPQERLEKHLASIPKRLRAVVKARGGYTKY